VTGEVIVEHGTYPLTEEIGGGMILVSEPGSSCKTIIDNDSRSGKKAERVTIGSDNARVGDRDGYSSRGFTFQEEVVIAPGVDATTVHLNWNNLQSSVENDGDGELDAAFNWWGDMDPSDDTKGEVDYHPFLPIEVCSFIDYMEKHGIKDPGAAAAARSLENQGGEKRLTSQLISHFNVKPREAEDLFEELGYGVVKRAFKNSDRNYDRFLANLGVDGL